MPRVTQELLRKRAEHNEMVLQTLEEISLHQQQLEKIENFDVFCRHLKILYLQNNIIEKMENLSKLKELEYLNLALNNISLIENIEGCESLRKLDLTVNFIDLDDLEESMVNLSRCGNIKELYLTGNPCEDWKGCRDFVIATVEQLEQFNGKEITKSERIKAKQLYDELLIDLYHAAEMRKIEKRAKQEQEKREELERLKQYEGLPEEEVQKLKAEEKKAYTKEMRREMYMDQAAAELKKEREKNPKKFEEKKDSPMYKPDGEIRQCNEGKYKFSLREWDDADKTFFDIHVPKFMDTSLLDVNLNPKWVSVRIKGKLTQLKLQEEISVEASVTQRSLITGVLSITMPKVKHDEMVESLIRKQEKQKQEELDQQKLKEEQKRKEREERLLLCDKYEKKAVAMKVKQDHTSFDDVPELE